MKKTIKPYEEAEKEGRRQKQDEHLENVIGLAILWGVSLSEIKELTHKEFWVAQRVMLEIQEAKTKRR